MEYCQEGLTNQWNEGLLSSVRDTYKQYEKRQADMEELQKKHLGSSRKVRRHGGLPCAPGLLKWGSCLPGLWTWESPSGTRELRRGVSCSTTFDWVAALVSHPSALLTSEA